ncbi:probable glutamate receptor [Dermacentor albipictus]|uniref:probable glutamate receptor n=1 Tax=Dermacentor albipictus TaxID=60249 RepID=UPI0031FD9CC9
MDCHLRVGILPVPVAADIKLKDNQIHVEGITEVFFSAVKNALNCTYSYHLASVLTIGKPYPNGTWSPGLMADLQNNLVNITYPGVARSVDRDALADPTSPIMVMPVKILAGRNRTHDTNVAGYLLTFDPQVWALLLFFLAFLSVVLALLDLISRRMRNERAAPLVVWDHHFWRLFENMFCEASATLPKRTALRIVGAVWLLAIVVLMNAFAGQMRACIMVKSELQKVNSLADIAARPHLKAYVLKNSLVTRSLEYSQGAAERQVWSMIRRDQSDVYGLLHFSHEMLNEIVGEKAVVIHVSMVAQNEAGKFCGRGEVGEFYFGTESMCNVIFGTYMSRQMNVDLRQRIKKINTRLMESGIVFHKYNMAIPSLDRCTAAREEEKLKLRDLASVFYVYAAFCLLSVLVFAAELVAGRYLSHRG